MTKSEQLNELSTALAKAQGEFQPASKNANNPFHKSRYADLASVVDVAREILSKHGLSVSHLPKFLPDVGWTLETVLLHSSGQFISCQTPLLPPVDKNGNVLTFTNQTLGASITYMRRYGFCAITGVVVDEDDDGETADGRGKCKPQYPQATPPAPQAPAPAAAPSAPAPQEPRVTPEQVNNIVEGLKLIDAKTLTNYHAHMESNWATKAGDYKNLPARAYDPTMTAIANNIKFQKERAAAAAAASQMAVA